MSGAGAGKRLNLFERYLSVWVVLCMGAGIALGKLLPGFTAAVRGLEFGAGSQINVVIAVLSMFITRAEARDRREHDTDHDL